VGHNGPFRKLTKVAEGREGRKPGRPTRTGVAHARVSASRGPELRYALNLHPFKEIGSMRGMTSPDTSISVDAMWTEQVGFGPCRRPLCHTAPLMVHRGSSDCWRIPCGGSCC